MQHGKHLHVSGFLQGSPTPKSKLSNQELCSKEMGMWRVWEIITVKRQKKLKKRPQFSNLINAGSQKLFSHGLTLKLGKLIGYIYWLFITCMFTNAAILLSSFVFFPRSFLILSQVKSVYIYMCVYVCVNKIILFAYSSFSCLCA